MKENYYMRGVLNVNEACLETSTMGYIMSLKSSIFSVDCIKLAEHC